jgi:WD40 repeat protein
VPAWLGELIARLHAKRPEDRPASAQEVADLLSHHLALTQASDTPPPSGLGGRPGASLRRRLLLVFLVGLLVALIEVALFLWPRRPEAPEKEHGADGKPEGRLIAPLELRRADIPPGLLALAGGGDPGRAPPELVAVLGDPAFRLPRSGWPGWPEQSPDGKLLAVPLERDVVLFESATGRYLKTLQGPNGIVQRVSFSRDGRLLAAASEVSRGWAARVWEAPAWQELSTAQEYGAGPVAVGDMTFTPDGRCLVAAVGTELRLLHAGTGLVRRSLGATGGPVPALRFSPDGRRLAAALQDGRRLTVFDWDGQALGGAHDLGGHRSPVRALAYSPDGKYLASGDPSAFKLWDADALRELGTVETAAAQLAFAPDGQALFAASTAAERKTVHTFTRWDAAAAFSPDGKLLATASSGGKIVLRDAASGAEVRALRGHGFGPTRIAFSPDGLTLAAGGDGGVVRLWDVAGGVERATLPAGTATAHAVAFSPDGRLLAWGGADRTVRVHDLATGQARQFDAPARVNNVAFSPDGRVLAAVGLGQAAGGPGMEAAVSLWDLASGRETNLSGHTVFAQALAFSPAGDVLATSALDGTVRLWYRAGDGYRGRTVGPGPFGAGARAVAFTPDGRHLVTANDNGTLSVLRVPPPPEAGPP